MRWLNQEAFVFGGTKTAILMSLVGVLSTMAVAQTPITAADAAPFFGSWTLVLQTPQGTTPLTLTLKDSDGKVTAEISSDVMPVQFIADVSKADRDLVLKYTRDMGGISVPVKVTLRPAADKMMFEFDMAGGQIVLEGIATKK